MELSSDTQNIIGWLIITIVLVEYGGVFVLSKLRSGNVPYSQLQNTYYRAGHAHAGVLVILAILAQILMDAADFDSQLDGLVRAGFFLTPILIPSGFFFGAPRDSDKPNVFINLIYIGAVLLALSALALGGKLVFG